MLRDVGEMPIMRRSKFIASLWNTLSHPCHAVHVIVLSCWVSEPKVMMLKYMMPGFDSWFLFRC